MTRVDGVVACVRHQTTFSLGRFTAIFGFTVWKGLVRGLLRKGVASKVLQRKIGTLQQFEDIVLQLKSAHHSAVSAQELLQELQLFVVDLILAAAVDLRHLDVLLECEYQ